jgi:hypothetical protein
MASLIYGESMMSIPGGPLGPYHSVDFMMNISLCLILSLSEKSWS